MGNIFAIMTGDTGVATVVYQLLVGGGVAWHNTVPPPLPQQYIIIRVYAHDRDLSKINVFISYSVYYLLFNPPTCT